MNRVQQAYAVFFNAKYGDSVKKGLKSPVFEGRFQAKVVEDEEYLSQLTQYVLQNAVHHEIVEEPREWPWVSERVDTMAALEKFESVFD